MLTHALVISSLEDCNTIFVGLPLKTTHLIQNAVTLVVMDIPQYIHVTPLLCEIHWSSVSSWVQFKVLAITYKVLYGTELITCRDIVSDDFCMSNKIWQDWHPPRFHYLSRCAFSVTMCNTPSRWPCFLPSFQKLQINGFSAKHWVRRFCDVS